MCPVPRAECPPSPYGEVSVSRDRDSRGVTNAERDRDRDRGALKTHTHHGPIFTITILMQKCGCQFSDTLLQQICAQQSRAQIADGVVQL